MSNYHIGLSGLRIAQRAIELIGTNIANAATEGYHRQELRISPLSSGSSAGGIGGAEIAEVRRNMDVLLEREILRQRPQAGQVSQQLLTLQTIENALGDIDSEGLGQTLNVFFNSLRELSAQPTSQGLREQVIWAADGLATQFRSLGAFLARLDDHILLQAQQLTERVNSLAAEAAELNGEIRAVEARGGVSNLLRDRRDQKILELADLVDVQIEEHGDEFGVVNVVAWGTPLVLGSRSTELEAGLVAASAGADLGVSVKGANYFVTNPRGGQIGALLALKNETLPELEAKLDALAKAVIDGINQLHVQGVGTAGSFTELIGWAVESGALATWDPDISAGDFHLRVIDQTTGQVTRHAVAVDPSVDTIADVASRLDALDNLSASVADGTLRIQAGPGYEFDFLPALDSAPYTSGLTGSAGATISGLYTGQQNQIYTCTVSGSGGVGITSGLSVEVRNGAGELLTTLNVGLGYAAGDALDIGNGIKLAFSTGTLNNAEQFTIQALADSDPTGLLAATGMNAFFQGNSATSISVRPELLSDSARLATSRGGAGSDNANILRMAELSDTQLAELDDATPVEYYRQFTTGIGQSVASLQARQSGLENIMEQLAQQRERLSGVDINEEAANLLVFERMFQAVSQFINVQDRSIQYLLNII